MSRFRKCLVAILMMALLLVTLSNLAGCAEGKIPTSTTIRSLRDCGCSSSSDNVPCRHTVTFWVVVAGKTEVEDEPSGSIDFWDGATLLGTVPLAPGQETVTEFELLVGTCEITASYSGDAHFARSKSAVEILKVGGWTNTTLTSSCNPSTLGDSVTFTATVTPEARTGLATGTISFWERHHIRGGYALDKIATATIDSGRANYTTSSLSVGVHDMYASYEGDTDFEESKSGFLMQTVS